MWRTKFFNLTAVAPFVLTMLASPVGAQNPRTQSQTSAVQRLTHDSTAKPTVSGVMRYLRCRGKPGIDIRMHQDPSPRSERYVTMALRYDLPKETRILGPVGMGTVDYGMSLELIPGSCTWRTAGSKDIPFEPGVVYFDISRDAQMRTVRDTSIDVAVNLPDVASLPRYLNDSTRYWGFFVDDVTKVSVSHGSRGVQVPMVFPDRERDTTAGVTIRSSATAKPGTASKPATIGRSTTVRTSPGTDKVSAPKPNSVAGRGAGPVSTGSPARSLPDARKSGNPTAGTATVVRAPLQLRGVSTALGGFTVNFSARANSSPSLRYSTDRPVRNGQTGEWAFPGGRAATGPMTVGGQTGAPPVNLGGPPKDGIVLPGSPAVPAGTEATVVRQSTDVLRAQYIATSRPGTVGRGLAYHYIITVPGSSEYFQEQYVGQLTTVSQSVRMTITSFTILKSTAFAKDLKYEFVAWTDVGGGGSFGLCQGATCENTGHTLRLLVYTTQPPTSGSVFTTPGWSTSPSESMGIARREFDLRTIPDDRPLRAFTLRSQSGHIEFEVQGTLEVVRR